MHGSNCNILIHLVHLHQVLGHHCTFFGGNSYAGREGGSKPDRVENSIQFNSIQYRHLYVPANEHHVGAHGEETKLQRKIKYMNDKRKKSVNFEKVRFQFCSEGVERESGITQVHRERVPHGRRGVVEPSWTQCLCFGSWDVQKSVQARG